jgi:Flp pilus assembly protein TadG
MFKSWKLKRKKGERKERGMVTAVAAIGFVSLALAAGLAIDVSNLYTAGTELQNAADASALAAATALNSTKCGVTRATDLAVATTNKYNFNSASAAIERTDVKFGVNLSDLDGTGGLTETQALTANPVVYDKLRFVKVTVPPKNVGIFFASAALNATSVSLTRSAVAGQSRSGAPNGVNDSPNEICNIYRMTLIEDDVDGGELDRIDPNCGDATKYTQGCTYTVHMTPPCAADAGYFEITDGSYNNETNWEKRLANRLLACYSSGVEVPVWTHPNNTQIKKAFNTIFNIYNNTVLTRAEYPPDTNIKENITWAQYQSCDPAYVTAPSAGPALHGRRVLILPIMKKSSFVVLDANGDFANMKYYKFGAFFLVKKITGNNNNGLADFRLEYIGDPITLGNAAFDPAKSPAAGNTAGLAMAVLYK